MNTIELEQRDTLVLAVLMGLLPILSFIYGLNYAAQSEVKADAVVQEIVPQPEAVTPIESMEPINVSKPLAARFEIQANVFADYDNALAFKDVLIRQGLDATIVHGARLDEQPVYRIVVSTFDKQEQAVKYARLAQDHYGIPFYVKRI